MKILVVDDDRVYQMYIAELAREKGCYVFAASDPVQAQQVALKERPDLIILDINMPAGGGKAAYRRLKQSIITNNIPIVIVSGAEREQYADLIAEFSIDQKNIFQKPIDEELFISRVKEICPQTGN